MWKYIYSKGTHNLIDVLDRVNVYKLADHEGEPIIGKFYEEEQSAFDKKDDDLYRMDLVNMSKYKSVNGEMYWILTAIEILRIYAFAIPVYVAGHKQHDQGSDPIIKGIQALLTTRSWLSLIMVRNFTILVSKNLNTAVVKRFNRIIKTAMWNHNPI